MNWELSDTISVIIAVIVVVLLLLKKKDDPKFKKNLLTMIGATIVVIGIMVLLTYLLGGL